MQLYEDIIQIYNDEKSNNSPLFVFIHQGNCFTGLAFSALKFLIKHDCLIGHELRHVIHGNLLLLGGNKDFDMIKDQCLTLSTRSDKCSDNTVNQYL